MTNWLPLKKAMWSKTLVILFGLICSTNGVENKARYDNYRMYQIQLKTDLHVKVLQKLTAISGQSYPFESVPREANRNATILAAAHTIAQLTDILNENKIDHAILVSQFSELSIKYITSIRACAEHFRTNRFQFERTNERSWPTLTSIC